MKRTEINIRDPFVLVHEGAYYLYVSRDLENWDGPFVCFHNDGSFWADRNYQAPQVYFYHGAFYMFASFKHPSVKRGTAVLRAESPMGPFVPHSDGCVTPKDWECLDGTLYISKAGKPYMVFCHEWVQAGDGEVDAIPLTDDLRAPAGKPVLLFHASEATWCQVKHHSSGVVGCVTDGPVVTIEADRVTMPLNDQQTLLAYAGRAEEGGGVMTCCGMQNGELHVLARVLRAPFTLDMTIRFDGGKAEMTLSGVGQESKTFALTKK